MLRLAKLILLTGLLGSATVFAGIRETLPTFHWAYDYIDELRVHGYFEDFYILNRPFTRGQIAEYLIKLDQRRQNGAVHLSKADCWLFDRLHAEFAPEMQRLLQKSQSNRASVGTYFIQEFDRNDERSVGHFRLRSKASIAIANRVELYNGIVFDNRLDEDSTYIGKRQGDIASFTEQAYITTGFKNFEVKLGRDFVRFGSGHSATLMISDFARPMDQLWASYTHKYFKFSFFTSSLDPMMVPDTSSGTLVRANRFLAAHRLEFKLFHRFYFGLTESILYGGPASNWQLAFLNPFIFYHGVQLNGPVTGNTLGSIDFALYPVQNLGVYGELLIDDIQLEHSKPADLEPNELGFILGLQITDPLQMSGTRFIGEYSRVTNRTYNTQDPWEKFLHRGRPIGHFLGNDFDRWDLNLSQWLLPGLQVRVGYEHIRRGEGRIQNKFDQPWLQFTVEQGYSEPFPTGVVETSNIGKFQIVYHPSANLRFNLSGKFRNVDNVENQLGRNNSEFSFILGLWFEGDLRLGF
ncbi:MAG: capsule assembly Wzi family protein [bacterium]